MAEHPAEVDEVLLARGPLGERDSLPLGDHELRGDRVRYSGGEVNALPIARGYWAIGSIDAADGHFPLLHPL